MKLEFLRGGVITCGRLTNSSLGGGAKTRFKPTKPGSAADTAVNCCATRHFSTQRLQHTYQTLKTSTRQTCIDTYLVTCVNMLVLQSIWGSDFTPQSEGMSPLQQLLQEQKKHQQKDT